MYCIHCGSKISEGAFFCTNCGKPVATKAEKNNQTDAAKPNNQVQSTPGANIHQMAMNSMIKIANSSGYYCFECGCYVNRQRAECDGTIFCMECGAPIINPNFNSHAGKSISRFGLLGGVIHTAMEKSNYSSNNPLNYVMNYYQSAYYYQTKNPFERVATDKGKMGEYLVEVGFQAARRMYPHLKPYIIFNLLVPESNGSFQEIDALVVIGSVVYVIEAKNRGGIFSMNAVSDKYWSFRSFAGETTQVYNPLMQNNEHVVALQSYLADKLDFQPTFANFVALSGKGCMDWNIQTDTIDSILLGNWNIFNTRGITGTFRDEFQCISQGMASEEYSQGARELDDKYAKRIIEALKPLLDMSEETKRAKQKDRMADDTNGGKTPYNYFYLEIDDNFPILLRSNFVHTQILDVLHPSWICADDSVGFIERKGIYWKNKDVKSMWYKIKSYEELLEAYNCAINFTLFQHKDREKWENQNQEKRHTQSSASSGYEEMFFHGCDDLETLNARYRNLCKTFHPDGKSGDEESFKKMQEAYEKLKQRMNAS